MIPRLSYQQILEQQETPRPSSAVFIDQPIARQLRLLVLALPQRRRVGVLLGPSSSRLADEIRAAAAAPLQIDLQSVPRGADLVSSLRDLLSRNDVLLAVADPEIYSSETAQGLLLITYHAGIPMMGFSQSYVRAGALLAVYSSPGQIGRQVGEVVQAMARTGFSSLPPPAYPRHFSVAVNRQVGRSLGLSLPDDAHLLTRLRETEP
jgi:ABC-type uncharacterized transport system substrate-binding protein